MTHDYQSETGMPVTPTDLGEFTVPFGRSALGIIGPTAMIAGMTSACGKDYQHDAGTGTRILKDSQKIPPSNDTFGDSVYLQAYSARDTACGYAQGAAVVLAVSLAVVLALQKILR